MKVSSVTKQNLINFSKNNKNLYSDELLNRVYESSGKTFLYINNKKTQSREVLFSKLEGYPYVELIDGVHEYLHNLDPSKDIRAKGHKIYKKSNTSGENQFIPIRIWTEEEGVILTSDIINSNARIVI